MRNFLALDPSFRNLGWVVFQFKKQRAIPIDCGCITTRPRNDTIYAADLTHLGKKHKSYKACDNHRCSMIIATQLMDVIDNYQPVLICAESSSGSKDSRAAKLMGMVAGVLSSTIAIRKVPYVHVDNKMIKKILIGSSKKVSKDQIREVVSNHYKNLENLCSKVIPKGLHEHMYDAASVFMAIEKSKTVIEYRCSNKGLV